MQFVSDIFNRSVNDITLGTYVTYHEKKADVFLRKCNEIDVEELQFVNEISGTGDGGEVNTELTLQRAVQ